MKVLGFMLIIFLYYPSISQVSNNQDIVDWAKENLDNSPKQSIDTLLKSAEKAKNIGNYLEYTELLTALAQIYAFELNNNNLTLDILKKINEAYQQTNDINIKVYYLLVLGYIYHVNKENNEKVFEIYEQALKICPRTHPKWIYVLNNYGAALMEVDSVEKGVRTIIEAYHLANNSENHSLGAMSLRNIGVGYSYLKKPDSTLYYYKKSHEEFSIAHDNEGILELTLAIGIFFYEQKNLDSAFYYMNKVLAGIEIFKGYGSKQLSYKLISLMYEDIKNYKLAYEYGLMFDKYKDSVNISETSKRLLSYEFELQIKEMNKKSDSEKRQMKYDKERMELIYIIIFLSLITIIIIVWIILLRLRNKKKLLKIKSENTLLEKEKVEMDLEFHERIVASKTMFLLEKDNLINRVINILDNALPKTSEANKSVIADVINELRLSLNNKRWEEFELRFNKIHPNFYFTLEKKKSNLSNNEKRLCAFLFMKMSSKEISNITGQSLHSINVARTRLRKKVGLTNSETSISGFLSNL